MMKDHLVLARTTPQSLGEVEVRVVISVRAKKKQFGKGKVSGPSVLVRITLQG